MRSLPLSRWLLAPAALAMVLAACGGGAATATPKPTVAPTRQPTATVQVQPTATAAAQPTATSAPATQATATALPTAAPTATPRPAATLAPTATPAPQGKYGGILKLLTNGPPSSFDPFKEVSQDVNLIIQPVYDQMVAINPQKESEIIPQLAESWTISGDSLTYTFKLRKGILFTNGDTVTAQDVKYSYESIMRPPAGTPSPMQSSLASIETITAPDDYTVTIKLKSPDAAVMLSMGQGRAAIVNSKLLEKEGGRERLAKWPPVSTGPFEGKADGYVRGVSTKVVKNDRFWVPGRPYMDAVQVFVIPDLGTQFAAFLAGQVNFSYAIPTAAQQQEARTRLGDKLAIQTTPTTTWTSIEINIRKAPFDDLRVRRAVALAADKQSFMKVPMKGMAILGGNTPPGGWELPPAELAKFDGYRDDTKANLAQAKQLLTEAGFPNGFKIQSYFTRNQQGYIDNSVFVKALLKEIAIEGDLQLVDSARFFDELLKPDAHVLSVQGHRTALTDPNSAYQTFHLCKGGRNYTGMCDPKVLQLYDAQNMATDPAKRRALVWDMERYTLGIYHNIILGYTVAANGYASNIKNYTFQVSETANRQYRDVWME